MFRETANGTWDGLETFGQDLERVRRILARMPQRVWTVVDGDDGNLWICAGYRFVNRVFYVVTEQEWSDSGESYPYESDFCRARFESSGKRGSSLGLARV